MGLELTRQEADMLYYMSLGFEPHFDAAFEDNEELININEKLHEKLIAHIDTLPKIEGETYVSES